MMRYLKTHFFSCTITLFILFVMSGSYYRFIVKHDYLIYYHVECSPYTETCFVHCEDKECAKPSYYKEIVRKANKIIPLCGQDVSTCEAAKTCPTSEVGCEVTYCNPDTSRIESEEGDECENLNVSDLNQ